MNTPLRKPWMVAVWPGMGGVAHIAGSYLVRVLDAKAVDDIDVKGFFDVQTIAIKSGLAQPVESPRHVLYGYQDPAGVRDLLILLGDRQPNQESARYTQTLLDVALRHGVERVVTFAAMATPIQPTAAPRVFGVATRVDLLSELVDAGVSLLDEGEVTGLNGVFIAAAAARGIPGSCLLGEFPFFAAGVPNPKASVAVLRSFSTLSGIPFDLGELEAEAERIERSLSQHMEGLRRAAEASGQTPELASEPEPDAAERAASPPPSPPVSRKRRTSPEVLEQIERLFAACREDRSKATTLKSELDRFGLFKDYEDRFLDLFKQAN